MSLDLGFTPNKTHFNIYPPSFLANAYFVWSNGIPLWAPITISGGVNDINYAGCSVGTGPILGVVPVNTNLTFFIKPFRCSQLDNYGFPADTIGRIITNAVLNNIDFRHQRMELSHDSAAKPGMTFSGVIATDPVTYYNQLLVTESPASVSLSLMLFGIEQRSNKSIAIVPLGGGGTSIATFTCPNPSTGNITAPIDLTGFGKAYIANKNNYPHFCFALGPNILLNIVTSVDSSNPTNIINGIFNQYHTGNLSEQHITELDQNLIIGTVDYYSVSYGNIELGPMQIEMTNNVSLPDDSNLSPVPPSMLPLT